MGDMGRTACKIFVIAQVTSLYHYSFFLIRRANYFADILIEWGLTDAGGQVYTPEISLKIE